jgi:hypothetical protein
MFLGIKNKISDFYLVNSTTFTLIAVSMCKFLYGFYTAAIGSILVPLGAAFNINIRTQSVIFPFNYFGQIAIIFFCRILCGQAGEKSRPDSIAGSLKYFFLIL